eukprot:jgi/Botrbrau1/15945/Bobra.0260s0006.1
MSSLRNAVKRKTHKERAQPAARRHFGLLEKKKDYKARAENFHKRQDALQVLHRKAEERNPDEYYFGMVRSRTKGGVHVQERTVANKYSQEELLLMRTQDVGYTSMKRQVESKKLEKLRERLHFVGAGKQTRHTVFVDSEREARNFSAEEFFDTPAELLDRAFNRPRRSQLGDPATVSGAPEPTGDDAVSNPSALERKRAGLYKELLQRKKRLQVLSGLTNKLALQKELMGKGSKRKLKGRGEDGEAPVFKWKRERKK